MVSLVLYSAQNVDLNCSLKRNDRVKGLSQGVNMIVKHLWYDEKVHCSYLVIHMNLSV